MALNIDDVKKWHDAGLQILPLKEKLDSRVNESYNSRDFMTVYYGISNPYVDLEIVHKSIKNLSKRASSVSPMDFKLVLKEFIAVSNIVYKKENINEFKRLLRENGWLPDNPEIERRKAREAAERARREQEERARLRRIAEEKARKEHEERKRREYEMRLAKERNERRRRMRRFRIVLGGVIAILLIYGLVQGVPYYRYHHIEYRALLADAENYLSENKYAEARSALEDARLRKSNKKAVDEITVRISEVEKEWAGKIIELQEEIKNVWNAYFMNDGKRLDIRILKYVDRNDAISVIDNIQQRIELLKTLTSDTKEYDENMRKLDTLKKYFNC